MRLDEALKIVASGGKVTSASLPNGTVLKEVVRPRRPDDPCEVCSGDCAGANPPMIYCPRKLETYRAWHVMFEATGDHYAFQNSEADQAADWREVGGWNSYG